MIGIKTAEAVITDLETLLLANTQEFSLAYSLLYDSLTCSKPFGLVIVQGANFMFSRCLIYKVHSAERNSLTISRRPLKVKNFFPAFPLFRSCLSRQPDYLTICPPLCQELFG